MKTIYLFCAALLFVTISATSQSSKKSQPQFTIQKADSLFSSSAWKSAITVYEGALSAAPANSLAWNRLAFCYHNLGDYEKAIANYNKALEYNPNQQLTSVAQSRLARVYSLRKEMDKAFLSLDKALQSGYFLAGELQNHADFENLRKDPRFAKAVESATNNAMPCLVHAQSREFDFWIGEWDVYPNGANVVVGHSKIEMASGGCMILENWTAMGNAPSTGKSMNYVNPATGKWEQFWIGSGGITPNNPQRFVSGEYKNGAMRFEFEGSTAQGQKQIGRFIFYNQGPDQVRQFNEVSADNGTTWTTVYDFIYKRKK